jgi:nucleoid DNA-binding protein
MTKRYNKNDLATILVESGSFETKVSAVAAIEAVTSAMANIVIAGNAVAIPDFGKFEAYTRENGMVKPKFIPFGTFKESVGSAK